LKFDNSSLGFKVVVGEMEMVSDGEGHAVLKEETKELAWKSRPRAHLHRISIA